MKEPYRATLILGLYKFLSLVVHLHLSSTQTAHSPTHAAQSHGLGLSESKSLPMLPLGATLQLSQACRDMIARSAEHEARWVQAI